VSVSTPLLQLARAFDVDPFAVVQQTQKTYLGGDAPIEKSVVVGVVTRIDLISFITGQSASAGGAGTPRLGAAAAASARAPSPPAPLSPARCPFPHAAAGV
jgi:hypothetical protein